MILISHRGNTNGRNPEKENTVEYIEQALKKGHHCEIDICKFDGEKFVVTSGAGPGIMEAANRGAHDAKGKTVGLGISLPFEQTNNKWITKGLNFVLISN